MTQRLQGLFPIKKPIIGVVHLLPLPGSPLFSGNLAEVCERAQKDAHALAEGGVDGIIIENLGDLPFLPHEVEPHTISLMTRMAVEVANEVHLPLGINVLRNDARAALAVALACGARFIRVNVHTGVMATDAGLIAGQAHATLRYREKLKADVQILADVFVKHAFPLAGQDIRQVARDTAYRSLADALIVTGPETGKPVNIEELKWVKEATPDVPVLAGSGVRIENVSKILTVADGLIVGTAFKEGGETTSPVDRKEVERFIREVEKARG